MESNSKFYGILRQKNNIEELNIQIANCESEIKSQENNKKLFKRWAIIPPVVILTFLLFGSLAIDFWFNGMDGISILTFLETVNLPLLVPLAASIGFPAFYGYQYHEASKKIKDKEAEKERLEEYRNLNEVTLKKLEQEYHESQKLAIEENKNKTQLLKEFFFCEKDRLIKLYNNGRLGELAWPIDDVLYLQGLIEDEINYQESLVNNHTNNLSRSNPKMN
ncbi:MAG TPA: hypothetical protein IAB40_06210 [Candidatus Onthocola stercoravium]|nr:hypothetical protein [Candidatus Onthocola stercoravium]